MNEELQAAVGTATEISYSRSFYVEARVGSSNYRSRGEYSDPCRAVWKGAERNEPADAVIKQLASAVVVMSRLIANPLTIPGVQELLRKERERCAVIAQKWADDRIQVKGMTGCEAAFNEGLACTAPERIAQAIRNLEPQ